jgi:hypothetical protein
VGNGNDDITSQEHFGLGIIYFYACLAGRLAYVKLEDETGNKSSSTSKPQFQSLNLVG